MGNIERKKRGRGETLAKKMWRTRTSKRKDDGEQQQQQRPALSASRTYRERHGNTSHRGKKKAAGSKAQNRIGIVPLDKDMLIISPAASPTRTPLLLFLFIIIFPALCARRVATLLLPTLPLPNLPP